MKPRNSSARAIRLRNAASSSAISSVRSLAVVAPARTGDTGRGAPMSWLMASPSTFGRYVALKTGFGQRTDTAAPPARRAAIAEAHVGPGPFQQRLGDEDPQSHVPFLALARGNEGRARARPAGPRRSPGRRRRPRPPTIRSSSASRSCTSRVREGHGVLHDVSDALHDLGTAHLDRRGGRHALADRPGLEGDRDAVALVVLRRRLDQRRQRHQRVGVRHVAGRIDRQPRQDRRGSGRTSADSSSTSSRSGSSSLDLAQHLLGDHGDGRQRRAELVRRGRRQRAQRRHALLARQGGLRGQPARRPSGALPPPAASRRA